MKNLMFIWVILELIVFAIAVKVFGALLAILLIIISSIAGSAVLKLKGFSVIKRMQAKMQAGEQPNEEILEAFSIAFGGLLLIIPGFITSILGIILLIPHLRRRLAEYFINRKTVKSYFSNGSNNDSSTSENGRVIDGECKHED